MSQNSGELNKTENRTGELLYHFKDGVRRLFLLIILFAFVGAIAAFAVYTITFKPVYSVSVVSTVSADVAGGYNYYNEASVAQISAAFPQIIESDTMKSKLMQVSEDGRVGDISAFSTEDSNLFSIKVTSSSPDVAFNTMMAIVDYYPEIMDYVLGPTQISFLTEPSYPTSPDITYTPFKAMAVGTAIGIVIALVIIFADAYYQDTIISDEDVRKKLGTGCLGELPMIIQKKTIPVTVLENIRQNGFSDSVRSMANKFLREAEKENAKVIFLTSTFPDEGKTTVSVNLSVMLASKGKRVLLCDADIKSPAVKRTLGISDDEKKTEKSLEDILAGNDDLEKAVSAAVLKVENPGLDVLLSAGAGSDIENAADSSSELLGSKRMKELVEYLKKSYDFIIFDTAPAGLVSDAQTIARVSDGFIYVVRQDTVRTDKLVETLDGFSFSGAKLLGAVINMATYFKTGYGYGKYGYGKYGYGKYGYGKYGYGSYGYGSYGYGSNESKD